MVKNNFFFKALSVLSMGTLLVLGSCNSYEDDIAEIKDRLDKIEAGQISSIADQIKEIKNSLTELQNVDKTTEAQIAELQKTLSSTKSELEAKITAGDNKAAADLSAEVASLTAKINALESAKAELQQKVSEIEGKLDSYASLSYADATYATKKYVEEVATELAKISALVSTNSKSIEEIQKAVETLTAALDGVDGAIQKALESYYDAKEIDALLKATSADAQTRIDALKKASEEADEAILKTIEELEGRIEVLENASVDFSTKNEEFVAGVNEIIATALENGGYYTKEEATILASKVSANEAAIESINSLLHGLEVNVDALVRRVQSIVYIPESADHCAKVTSLQYDGALLAEGSVSMTFQIQPLDAAEQIADAWGANHEILSFYTVEVTKAAEPGLEITSVTKGSKDGQLVVVAKPVDFGADFYSVLTTTTYSVALRLANTIGESEVTNDITSNFVNLKPATASVLEGLVLVGKNEEGASVELVDGDSYNVYKLDYADTEAKAEILKDFVVMLKIDGENVPVEEVAAAYGMGEVTTACTHSIFNKAGNAVEESDNNIFVVADEEGACQTSVMVGEVTRANIGAKMVSEHVFTTSFNETEIASTVTTQVTIVKSFANLTLGDYTKVWQYSEYKEEVDDYASVLTFSAPIVEGPWNSENNTVKNIPVADLAKWWDGNATVTVTTEEGSTTATAAIVKTLDSENNIQILFTGAEFGQKYTVEIVSVYSSIDVTYKFNVELVALPETLEVGFDSSVSYVYGQSYLNGSEVDAFENMYSENQTLLENYFADYDEFREYIDEFTESVERTASRNEAEDLESSRLLYGEEVFVPVIFTSEVEKEDDAFVISNLFHTKAGMDLGVTAKVNVNMPVYSVRYNPAYVSKAADGSHFASVSPLLNSWGFNVNNVNLNTAFVITEITNDTPKDLSSSDVVERGIELNFDFADGFYHTSGLSINGSSLTYKGYATDENGNPLVKIGEDEFAPVVGTLTVGGIELSAAFENCNDFSVKKCDPIAEFTTIEPDPVSISGSTVTYLKASEYLNLKDMYGNDVIVNGEFVLNQNGIYDMQLYYSIQDLEYGDPVIEYVDHTIVSNPIVDLEGIIVNYGSGQIRVYGTNKLQLASDVKITVPVTLTYPWNTQTVDVVFTITK